MSSVSIIDSNGNVVSTNGATPATPTLADKVRAIQKRDVMVMASNWAKRLADESYFGVADMLEAARTQESLFKNYVVDSRGFKVEAGENGSTGKLLLTHPELPCPHLLNNFATKQICQAIGAPQAFLGSLAPTTAAAVITERLTGEPTALANMLGVDKVASVDRGNLTSARISHDNRVVVYGASSASGKGLVRCIATQAYTPVLASALLARLDEVTPQGWRCPPARPSPSIVAAKDPRIHPATEADVINWGNAHGGGAPIKVGDLVGPAGAYMSDRDMAIILVNPERQITVDGQTLSPFVMLGEGLVNGIRSIWLEGGLLDLVCGNLIMWGVRTLFKFNARHVGNVDTRILHTLGTTLRVGARELPAATKLESQIAQARALSLGNNDDEATEAVRVVCAKNRIQIPQRDVRDAIGIAERVGRYGNPRSAWGVVQGLTELSQTKSEGCQDSRVMQDCNAGDLLDALLN